MFNIDSILLHKSFGNEPFVLFVAKTPVKKSKNLFCVTRPKRDKMQIHIKNNKKT